MSEEIEVLRIVTERLEAAGMPYMVTGSMALGVYAVPRMTCAIDLVVELAAADADRICALFGPYRRTEFARRRRLTFEGDPLFVVAPEDLVISKLEWARDTRSEMQLGDVRHLLRSVPDLDRAYLEHWMARLGLVALYREVGG